MKPLQPSPNATTTANANIKTKKPATSLFRKTKADNKIKKPPVRNIAYNQENHDHHSRVSELTFEKTTTVPQQVDAAHAEADMSSLSQASVQYKAKIMRRQKKQPPLSANPPKIMDLHKVQPQQLLLQQQQKDKPMELPTIFSATSTPQSQKEVTPIADNRGKEVQKEVTTETLQAVHNNKKFDKVKALLHRMNPMDRVKAMQKSAPVMTQEVTMTTTTTTDESAMIKKETKKATTWLQVLEDNKPKLLQAREKASREEALVPSTTVHPKEPPATLLPKEPPSMPRSLVEPHPEMDGVVSLVDPDGPRPPNAPTPVHRTKSTSDIRRTSFEPPEDDDDDAHKQQDAPDSAQSRDDEPDAGEEQQEEESQEFFQGMLKALDSQQERDADSSQRSDHKKNTTMRERLFRRSFKSMHKERGMELVSSEEETLAGPAVDAAAMMAALESTLPPRPKRKTKSPRRSTSAESPRRLKFAQKAAQKAEKLQKSRKQHPAMQQHRKSASMDDIVKQMIAERPVVVEDSPLKPELSSSHDLTATPSLPRNIVLSEDSLISDLDQSIRNFPLRQVIARTDLVDGLSSLEWTKQNNDSDEDEHTEDRYAITEDRYIPLSPPFPNAGRPISPRSPTNHRPMRLSKSHTNPENGHLGDALADSITEWSADNTARSRDTAEVALEVVLNSCNETPFGQICIRDTKKIQTSKTAPSSCLTSDNSDENNPSKKQGVRFSEEGNLVNKIFGMMAGCDTDGKVASNMAQEKTPLTSNRHFFGETEEDRTQDSASSNPAHRVPKVQSGPSSSQPAHAAPASVDKKNRLPVDNLSTVLQGTNDKLDDASGRYTCKSSKLGIIHSEAIDDDSDEENIPDRYSVNSGRVSSASIKNLERQASDSSKDSEIFKAQSMESVSYDKITGENGELLNNGSTLECRARSLASKSSHSSRSSKESQTRPLATKLSHSSRHSKESKCSKEDVRNDRSKKSLDFDKTGVTDEFFDQEVNLGSQSKMSESQLSTASPLPPEESDNRAQRDEASFRANIIERLGLDEQSLGIDTSVHLFSKVSSLHDDSESLDPTKYLDTKEISGATDVDNLKVSIDFHVEETPSLKQRLLSFGKQVVAMDSDKKLEVHEKINKLKPSAKGVLIRSIDRANPDIIDLTNFEDSDDLEDMEAVWLFDLSPRQVGAVHSILTFANEEHRDNLTNVQMVDKYQPVEIDERNEGIEIVQGSPAEFNFAQETKVVIGKSFPLKGAEGEKAIVKATSMASNERIRPPDIKKKGKESQKCVKDDSVRRLVPNISREKKKANSKPGILYSFFEQAEKVMCGGNAFLLEKGQEEQSDAQSCVTEHTQPPSLIFATIKSPASTFSTDSDTSHPTETEDKKVQITEVDNCKVHATEPNKHDGKALVMEDREIEATVLKDHEVKAAESKDRDVEAIDPKDRDDEETEPKDREVEATVPKDREVEATEPKDREVEATDPKDREVETAETKDHCVETEETKDDCVETAETKDHCVETAETKDDCVETAETKDDCVETKPSSSKEEIVEYTKNFQQQNQLLAPTMNKDLLDAIFEQTETLICGGEEPVKPPVVVNLVGSTEFEISNNQKNREGTAVIDLTGVDENHTTLNSYDDECLALLRSNVDESHSDPKRDIEESQTDLKPIAPPLDDTNQALYSRENEKDGGAEIVLSHGESLGIDFDEDSLPDSALQLMLFNSPVIKQMGAKTGQPPRPEDLVKLKLRCKEQAASELAEYVAKQDRALREKKIREAPRPETCLPLKKEHDSWEGKSTGPRPESFHIKKRAGQQVTLTENDNIGQVRRHDAVQYSDENVMAPSNALMPENEQQKAVDNVDFVTSITNALFTKGHGWIAEAGKTLDILNVGQEKDIKTVENDIGIWKSSDGAHCQSQPLENPPSPSTKVEQPVVSEKNQKDGIDNDQKESQVIDKNGSFQSADASLPALKYFLSNADVQVGHYQPNEDKHAILNSSATSVDKNEQDNHTTRPTTSSSHQLLSSSSEESLQLITESNLPSRSYGKNHSESSSTEESLVECGDFVENKESLLSSPRSVSSADSKSGGRGHLKSHSDDVDESKLNTIETIDPIIGPTSTVSVDASSVPFLYYDASSEVNTDVGIPSTVGPSPKNEEKCDETKRAAIASKAIASTATTEAATAFDEVSPRIMSQSSSSSFEARSAEAIIASMLLPVIKETEIENVDTEPEDLIDEPDFPMRVLSSGSFDRGFERLYTDKYKANVIMGISVPSVGEDIIVVQGEEVITGSIPTVDRPEEKFPTKDKEAISVSGKPVVQSQLLNAKEGSYSDDTKAVVDSSEICGSISNSKSDESVDNCESANDAPSKAKVTLNTISQNELADVAQLSKNDPPSKDELTLNTNNMSELVDVAPFDFFQCAASSHVEKPTDIISRKELDGIDPCGALGISTRKKKDASPTFAGSQTRSASAPKPRTSPIHENKPQVYTSSLMRKLQQRKMKRDEIRSNHSFSKLQTDTLEDKESLSGIFSLTSTTSSKSRSEDYESDGQYAESHKLVDPPTSQVDQQNNEPSFSRQPNDHYSLTEIISDDASTEADGSSLLLALTRSEGDEPLNLSPRSPSLILSPSSNNRYETDRASVSEKTEPVRNTATSKVEKDVMETTSLDETLTSKAETDSIQSASLKKTLDRIRANSSRSESGDMSIISMDTDPVDIDRLFSRYDSIVKNMVILDDYKLSQPKISKEVEIIDVTDQRSEQTSQSSDSFLSELPKRLTSVVNKNDSEYLRDQFPPLNGKHLTSTYQLEDIIESEDEEEVVQVTSFGSETTTPSEKARSLRYQLDQALKASAAIRNSQERLGMELHTFKNRLQLQRRELSPVRDQQSSAGYSSSHHSSVGTSRGVEQRHYERGRPSTTTSRRYYDREHDTDQLHVPREDRIDRIEKDRAKTYSPRSQRIHALADDDDEEEDDLFDFDESSEDDLEIDSAASSNEVKFQQLQSILQGLRQNEERKMRPSYY